MKFNLGEPRLKVDLQSLIDSRLLIQANSGGGKSWCIRRILEQTHGHVQQLVIDPEGEFGTLREKYDYVYAAKQGGDTAAHPRSAKLLAERLLELGVSAILDIYELKQHERVSFVRLFLEALIDAPKKLWHPVLIVVDEAHVYCPQKGDAGAVSPTQHPATPSNSACREARAARDSVRRRPARGRSAPPRSSGTPRTRKGAGSRQLWVEARLPTTLKSRDLRHLVGGHGLLAQPTPNRGNVDHILPLSRGGTHDPANLRLVCESTNLSRKADARNERARCA